MQLELRNTDGVIVGQVKVSDALMDVPFNPSLVHQAMVMYQLNKMQGTHSTKTRAEVAGGGAKPWAQKHTGRARAGSNRSPIWRHGGITFGPKPRSHRKDMPKRMRLKAFLCTLSQKVRENRLIVLEDIQGVDGKTKNLVRILEALDIKGSTLIVTEVPDSTLINSARNVPKIWTLPINLLNAGELLKRSNLVITLKALGKAEQFWGSKEELEVSAVSTTKPKQNAGLKAKAKVTSKAKTKVESKATTKVEPKATTKVEPKAKAKVEPKTKPKVEPKAKAKVEPKAKMDPKTKREPRAPRSAS
jgi:large subunit ribosomal protein L4